MSLVDAFITQHFNNIQSWEFHVYGMPRCIQEQCYISITFVLITDVSTVYFCTRHSPVHLADGCILIDLLIYVNFVTHFKNSALWY